jgi:hypothetical protein
MQISSVSNLSYQPAGASESFGKMKELFNKLGSALESGDLSAAQDAMTELQKNAPSQAGNDSNPMKAKMDKLSQALESGDITAAQDAYADIKNTLAQGPPAGGGPAGGPPPGKTNQSASAGSNSTSNTVYEKADLNKDGTVSATEELLYGLEHPGDATTSSASGNNGSSQGLLDVTV